VPAPALAGAGVASVAVPTGADLAPPPLAPASTTREWVPALQSLRGLAALWVVLYHLQVYLAFFHLALLPIPGLNVGWLGVDLFFVLSAYLLGQPFLEGRPPRLGRFVADRFLRIAPAYYAAFAVTALLYAVFLPVGWIPRLAWWSLVFLQNFQFRTFIAVNPAFWSLAVELQFYLLLPFLARLFRGRHWPWALAGCLLASYLYRALLFHFTATIAGSSPTLVLESFTIPAFLGHFALGLSACRIRIVPGHAGSGLRRAIFLVGLVLVAGPAAAWVPHGSVDFSGLSLAGDGLLRPLAACGFTLMVLATASRGWVARALSWRPIEWLGRISYSLYLIHIPAQVMTLLVIDATAHRYLWAATAAVASVAAGWLLYRAVEAPAEAWRRRWKLRRSATPPPAPPAAA